MVSLIGLITLFLRLSLAIQGQWIEYSDVASREEKIQCYEYDDSGLIIYSDSDFGFGEISLARKLEKEEKVEVEGFFEYSAFLSFSFADQYSLSYANAGFGTKAIRGSHPPLYDFFHSWKIHLS